MEKIELTEEIMLGCNSYLKIMEKTAMAEYIAEHSIDKVSISTNESGYPMPDMYKENAQRKSRYLMGALAQFYLGLPFEPIEGEKFMMDAVDYDKFAGSHILNQIERMKRSQTKEVREMAFDLLYDYREFEKRVNREISAMLTIMNDPTSRLLLAQQTDNTPEAFQAAQAELRKLADALEEYRTEKGKEKESEKKAVTEVTGEQMRPKPTTTSKRKKKTDGEGA